MLLRQQILIVRVFGFTAVCILRVPVHVLAASRVVHPERQLATIPGSRVAGIQVNIGCTASLTKTVAEDHLRAATAHHVTQAEIVPAAGTPRRSNSGVEAHLERFAVHTHQLAAHASDQGACVEMTDQRLIDPPVITALRLQQPAIKYRILWLIGAAALGLLLARAGLSLSVMNISLAIFAGISSNWSP